jgi:sulfur carrier protein ThiS
MVKVTFKLSDAGTVNLEIDQPVKFDKVKERAAQIAGIQLGGCIAVRNGKVITAGDLIEQNDEIDVFPAISGG